MTFFVINLADSRKRLAHMQALFDRCGLTFERIDAVNADRLSEEDRSRVRPPSVYDRFRRVLTDGEVACFLSHRKTWQAALAANTEFVAIFEDDIHFSPEAARILHEPENWLPADADVVKLETALNLTHLSRAATSIGDTGYSLKRLKDAHFGSAGYIMSRRAARILLNRSETIRLPLDDFLFAHYSPAFKDLRIYQVDPAICIQDQFLDDDSNIQIGLGSYLANRKKRDDAPEIKGGVFARAYIALVKKIRRRSRKTSLSLQRKSGRLERKTVAFGKSPD